MLDIVLPCRNAPAVVSMALTHLIAYGLPTGLIQSVTILDNNSSDPGMDAVLGFAAKHLPGTSVARYGENVGVWCSINRGLATTSAKYVLIVTSDLLIGPHTIPALVAAAEQHGFAFVSPANGTIGLSSHAAILHGGPFEAVPDYNGACWMFNWPRMRDAVGWYDPRFYVCFGDVDYIERARLAAAERNDPTLAPVALRGLNVCHLDKQTRRVDGDARGDATMEVQDGTRFHAKWHATHPEIAARHPVPRLDMQVAYKAQVPGGAMGNRQGWEQGKL